MPFVLFDVDKEIERQCAMDPEFKRIHEKNQRFGNLKHDLDELGELMTE